MSRIPLALALLLALSLPAPAQRSVPPEICGQWSYLSSGSGYSASRTLILHPNGTYEFYSEASTSGDAGSTAGQGSDSGSWWIDGALLCGQSTSGEFVQYEIDLMNHPRTGDPMLVIDGDWYVTATPREPWPEL